MSEVKHYSIQYPIIKLGDKLALTLHPTDPDAYNAVSRIAKVMCLSNGMTNEEILISTRENNGQFIFLPDNYSIPLCMIIGAYNETLKTIQMNIIGQSIVLKTLPIGGILLHGALIEKNGIGVMLVAPSGTGKTTASTRVKPPWRHICDDATLIIPDYSGNYYAHAWPTWSRFYNKGPGGCWNVQESILLQGIFFLKQSDENRIEPTDISYAIPFLVESIHQVMNFQSKNKLSENELKKIYQMELSAVFNLVKIIPIHILHISLTGPFWEKIEEVIQDINLKSLYTTMRVSPIDDIKKIDNNPFVDTIPVIYSGNSMYPTLKEPELLKITPYLLNKPRTGDVICFYNVEKQTNCIRRVVRINQNIIVISGDNPNISETINIGHKQILGKALFSIKDNKQKRILGGYSGLIWHQLIRYYNIITNLKPKSIKGFVLTINRFFFECITGNNSRVIIFYRKSNICAIKIFFKELIIAEYNFHKDQWIIKYPYSLWTYKEVLPKINLDKKKLIQKDNDEQENF